MTTVPAPRQAMVALERGARAVLDGSAVVTRAEAATAAAARVIEASSAAHLVRRFAGAWRQLASPQRRQVIGTALIAGVVTHLGLMVSQGRPPGWLWLVLPSLAAGAGVLCLLASRFPNGAGS